MPQRDMRLWPIISQKDLGFSVALPSASPFRVCPNGNTFTGSGSFLFQVWNQSLLKLETT